MDVCKWWYSRNSWINSEHWSSNSKRSPKKKKKKKTTQPRNSSNFDQYHSVLDVCHQTNWSVEEHPTMFADHPLIDRSLQWIVLRQKKSFFLIDWKWIILLGIGALLLLTLRHVEAKKCPCQRACLLLIDSDKKYSYLFFSSCSLAQSKGFFFFFSFSTFIFIVSKFNIYLKVEKERMTRCSIELNHCIVQLDRVSKRKREKNNITTPYTLFLHIVRPHLFDY